MSRARKIFAIAALVVVGLTTTIGAANAGAYCSSGSGYCYERTPYGSYTGNYWRR